MKKSIIMQILLGLFLSSCGKDSNVEEGTARREGSLSGKKYVVVSGSPAQVENEKMQGEGSIVFKDNLGGIETSKVYSLDFTVEDGGSVQLVTHADEKLENGVQVKFTRKGTELSVQTIVGSQQTSERVLKGIAANKVIKLHVEAHNNEAPTHVLIASEKEVVVFNSEDDGATPGQGKGQFWGLSFNKALVTGAHVDSLKAHDHH